jgi:lysophospholipase L1-like esterase
MSDSGDTKRRGGWWKNLALLFASLLVCFAAIEAYGRYVLWGPDRDNLDCYVEDWTLGKRLRPGFKGDHAGGYVEINSRGMRDREFELKKPAGTTRILALGDSWTFGVAMAPEQTWPKRLEALLGGPERGVEVMNTGVSGYETYNEAVYYEELKAFEHDLVLVGLYPVNDVHDKEGKYKLHKAVYDVSPLLYEIWTFPKRHLYVSHLYDNWRRARKLRKHAEFYAKQLGTPGQPPDEASDAFGFAAGEENWTALYTEAFSGWVTMRESLLAIGAIARQQGVPGAVILFPDLRHLERYRSYSHPHIEPMIRAAAEQAGLELIDLADDFAPYIGHEAEVSGAVGGTHPNARGYDLIAHAVAREIASRGLLAGSHR